MDRVHLGKAEASHNNAFEYGSGIHEAWAEISNQRSFLAREDNNWKKNKKSQVLLEGYVETTSSLDNDDEHEEDLTRSKSLTDDDLKDLKGCLDLGFGFSYENIPNLCNTLPALELCYSMSQKFLDDNNSNKLVSDSTTTPVANWKISSPGDNPDDVKARLKYWAQAVACTVQLCR